MIDISKAKIAFKKFLDKYEDKSDLSFQLKQRCSSFASHLSVFF